MNLAAAAAGHVALGAQCGTNCLFGVILGLTHGRQLDNSQTKVEVVGWFVSKIASCDLVCVACLM